MTKITIQTTTADKRKARRQKKCRQCRHFLDEISRKNPSPDDVVRGVIPRQWDCRSAGTIIGKPLIAWYIYSATWGGGSGLKSGIASSATIRPRKGRGFCFLFHYFTLDKYNEMRYI